MTRLGHPRIAGFGALVGTLAVVGGVPLLLVSAAGWPLPRSTPSVDEIAAAMRYGTMDPTIALSAVAIIAWIAWALTTLSILIEVAAVLRGTVAPMLAGLGATQRLASQLVATVMLLSSVATRAAASPPPVPPRQVQPELIVPSTTEDAGDEAPTTPSDSRLPRWTVRHRDSLWSIAAATLGDGHRWREIAALNVGRRQPDGDRLRSGDTLIRPGWRLRLPADARHATKDSRVAVVRPGDDLWTIAERHLGEGTRWREIFARNRERPQEDGTALVDPHVVRAGWTLRLPPKDSDDAERSPEVARRSAQSAEGADPSRRHPDAPQRTPAPTSPSIAPATTDAIREPRPPRAEGTPATPPEAGESQPSTTETTPDVTAAAPEPRPPVPPPGPHGARRPLPDHSTDSSRDAGSSRTVNDRPTSARRTRQGAVTAAIGPLALGASAVLAAGLLTLLRHRRRHWLQRRAHGTTIDALDPETAELERWLRSVADHDLRLRTDRVLRALTDLATEHDVAPVIDVVVLGDDAVVRLRDCVPAPHEVKAVDDGQTWVLPAEREIASPRSAERYLPAVVSCGQLPSGGLVLLNPLAREFVGVAGPDDDVRDAMTSWITELACGGATPDVDIIVVGDHDPLTERLPRVTIALDADAAAARVDALLEQSEQRSAIVLFAHTDDTSSRPAEARLRALARDRRVGVVAFGVAEAESCVELSDGRIRMSSDGDWLRAPRWLSPDDWNRFGDLLRHPAVGTSDVTTSLHQVALDEFDVGVDDEQRTEHVIAMLGPLQVDGKTSDLDHGTANLLTFLAVHRTGASIDHLARLLDDDHPPGDEPLRAARAGITRRFGTIASANALIDTDDGRLELHDAIGSDVEAWRRLLRSLDHQTPGTQARHMYRALQHVRGVPFSSGAEWAHTDGTALRLTTEIIDVAHRLSAQALLVADVERARWAARQGLLAAPTNELLHRDLLRVADARADVTELDACIADLRQRVEAGGGWVSDRTEQLYVQLRAHHEPQLARDAC